MINVGIIGGAGYTGGEMIRILLNHPSVNLKYVHSRSNAHQPLHKVHKDLVGDTEMLFTDVIDTNVDVIFLCLGHGESKVFLAENEFPTSVKIIDLSQDFRLGELHKEQSFVYGLPELNKTAIQSTNYIANPGCFATCIQLGLLPLAVNKLLMEVHTTGITGSTGAGQKLQASTHFTWRNNNVNAYKTLSHQHLKEVGKTLDAVGKINFVPWRGDFTRGIFVTSYMKTDLTLEEAQAMYKAFYENHPFTHVCDAMVDIKLVVNTNKCLIYLEKEGDQLVIHSVIDNLLKGASGQAVQNMNLMMGLPEKTGLNLKSVAF